MKIKTIHIQNFRMLKDVTVDLEDSTSLFIGKNNSGKTSFIVLLEKFLKNYPFDINDFPLGDHKTILDITDETEEFDLSIRLGMEIQYSYDDDLTYISSFIHDLNPEKHTVNILFEAKIDTKMMNKDLARIEESKNRVREIKKNLTKYIKTKYYIYDDIKEAVKPHNRTNLIEKDINEIKKLINVEVIHAKRDVASSHEDSSNRNLIISNLVSRYYNEKNKDNNFDEVNDRLLDLDSDLEEEYDDFFKDFLETSEMFLDGANLKVVSDLQSQSILKHNSKITYGEGELTLPENLKGLGYTNIIYLILNLEIKLFKFKNNKKSINLFVIEEPEAHTHPQMQYVFIKQIKNKLLKWRSENNTSLQTIITTHSSHIVNDCQFEDLRYFKVDKKQVSIRNFVEELEVSYRKSFKKDEANDVFKFIKQYLNIHSSELFFAEKLIMIEGITEKMLLPYFINEVAPELHSQNLTILEVGANAKAFGPLLDFLGIKTLIITDIDTVRKEKSSKKDRYVWKSCKVSDGKATSNSTLTYFFNAEKYKREDVEYQDWFKKVSENKIEQNSTVKVFYQMKENGYHPRSFEDAFLNSNYELIQDYKDKFKGVTNLHYLSEEKNIDCLFELTEKVLGKKSDFAADILYFALSEKVKWDAPKYIKDGLKWLEK